MTSTELIKLLKKNGWELKSTRGSHHKFRHPKKDLKIGLVNKLKKQAGL
ncbi:type II toxin-antitoxin system HicA family toxin [Vibrio sp. CK2-1]|nr:type II toxin-antitoxin system HicA family toxin [Vibrio sp. CK2-1]